MRTMDRRDQLLQLLRRRADWTAAGLARELGVSRRTVLRDLGGLREAGFDLATFSGPGGGVRLNPTSIMITSQLRASEVVALIVSVEIARAAKTVPFAAGAQQALAKIEQAPPPRPGPASYGRCASESWPANRPRTPGPPPSTPALVEAFENAFTSTRLLAFTYRDQQGRRSKRQAEPHGLLVRPPLWYVLAWDTGNNAPGSSAPTASAGQPCSATPSCPGPATWSPACAPTPGPQPPKRAQGTTPSLSSPGQNTSTARTARACP